MPDVASNWLHDLTTCQASQHHAVAHKYIVNISPSCPAHPCPRPLTATSTASPPHQTITNLPTPQRFLRRKPLAKVLPPPKRRAHHPTRLRPNLLRPNPSDQIHPRRRPRPNEPNVPRPHLRSRLHPSSHGSGLDVLLDRPEEAERV